MAYVYRHTFNRRLTVPPAPHSTERQERLRVHGA